MLDEVTFFYLKQLRCFADTVLILFENPRVNGHSFCSEESHVWGNKATIC